MDEIIRKLEEKKEQLHAQLQALLADENVDEAKVAGIKAEFEKAEAAIAARTKLLAMAEEMGGRIPKPQRKVQEDGGLDVRDDARFTGGDHSGARPKSFGFRDIGEFAMKVHKSFKNPHIAPERIDARLGKWLQAAATTYGSEGVGGDGGYLVPPDFRADIIKKLDGEESLLPLCQQINTGSNSVTLPIDEVTPWDATTGVLAYWEGEAATIPQSKPSVRNTTIRASKLTALVGVTDELLEDAPALSTWLLGKAPDKINFKVNDAIINGLGIGMPTGLMKSGSLITQAIEAGQATGSFVYNNVTKMFSRMREVQRRRPSALWLANQDVEPQLQSMVVPGGTPAIPAYLPPGGLSSAKYSTLMGKQIYYSEATQALGTPGDVVLADLSTYVAVVKGGGIRQDISVHLWFDADQTAFRWILRMGGQSLWATSISRPGGKQAYGNFIALAARP